MDIRSLILPTEEIVGENKKEKKITIKNVRNVKYTIELQDGCDFAISRKTSQSESLLVILMSQDQFYIRDMKTGEIKTLTVGILANFLADIDAPIELPNVNWLDSIQKGKKAAHWLLSFLCQPYSSVARRGMLYVPSIDMSDWTSLAKINNLVGFDESDHALYSWIVRYFQDLLSLSQKDAVKKITDLRFCNTDLAEERKIYAFSEDIVSLRLIGTIFGTKWAKEFLKMYMSSDCKIIPSIWSLIGIFYKNKTMDDLIENYQIKNNSEYIDFCAKHVPDRTFEAKRFIEYITYECCRQGKQVNVFMEIWKDCLCLQEDCYGTIRDKYPDALVTLRDKLTYLCSIRREELNRDNIEKTHWEQAAEMMKSFEWKPEQSEYQIVSPKIPDDMYDEHMQLQNCISGNVKRVIDGDCQIFFLRKSNPKEADESIVTIEVLPGNVLGQVQARNNEEPDPEHMGFIMKWAEEKGISPW